MSKIALTPSATGTGVFTISSPATNTNRTLTLPDEAGTVLTSASSLASANLTGSVPSSAMPAGSVLQVVSSVFTTTFTHSNTSFTDVGHSVSITPKSASSVLYLDWAGNLSTNAIIGMVLAIREGSTSIGGGADSQGSVFYYDSTYTNNTHNNQSCITSTPSTGLTARTFKISTKVSHGSGTNGAKYEGEWVLVCLELWR
jgi:hypothetical protein